MKELQEELAELQHAVITQNVMLVCLSLENRVFIPFYQYMY